MADAAPSREVARRVLAAEFNDARYTFTESDDERAPVYSLLPTGERANRVFVVGTLTETEDVGDDAEYWRGRIVDPTGTFFTYAGQYQPDAAATLRETETPVYAAVVGKPSTYETEEGDVNVSLRPESITVVDDATRDRWVVEAAELTLERIQAFDGASEGAPAGEDAGVAGEYAAMAETQYDPDLAVYRDRVVAALEDLEDEPEVAAEA